MTTYQQTSLASELKSKAASALVWSGIEGYGRQGIQLVIAIVLARMLPVSDFGLIAMIAIFLAVSQTLVDSGFGSALIQRKEPSNEDYSTIFLFNLMVGVGLYISIFLFAPLIAKFFKQPILEQVVRVYALVIILNSLGLVQETIMMKTWRFRMLAKIAIASIITSGAVGISMAYAGFGVWALVGQIIALYASRVGFLWLFSHWRPAWSFSLASLKSMFGYGSRLMISGLLDAMFNYLNQVIIGRMLNAQTLGYYDRAIQLQELPTKNNNAILHRVFFPVFSSIQDEPARLAQAFRKAISFSFYVNTPMMMLLMVVASPLIQVLLTDKWLPSVPYLQLLCIAGILYPLHALNISLLKAIGRSDFILRIEIIKKLLVIACILLLIRWEVLGLIYAMIVASVIAVYINVYYAGRSYGVTVWEHIKIAFPSLVVSGFMAGSVALLGLALPVLPPMIKLLIQGTSGLLVFFLTSRLLRLQPYFELRETFIETLRKTINRIKA